MKYLEKIISHEGNYNELKRLQAEYAVELWNSGYKGKPSSIAVKLGIDRFEVVRILRKAKVGFEEDNSYNI